MADFLAKSFKVRFRFRNVKKESSGRIDGRESDAETAEKKKKTDQPANILDVTTTPKTISTETIASK